VLSIVTVLSRANRVFIDELNVCYEIIVNIFSYNLFMWLYVMQLQSKVFYLQCFILKDNLISFRKPHTHH